MILQKKTLKRQDGETKNSCKDEWTDGVIKRKKLNPLTHKQVGISYQDKRNLKIVEELDDGGTG